MSSETKTLLKIDGMHCASCAINIDFELEDITGVKQAKTHYAKGHCEVIYNAQECNCDQIIATIAKLGYKATISN